jgi:hypothetical protein
MNGRKAIRTHDNLMRDDMRGSPTAQHDHDQRLHVPVRWGRDVYDEHQLEHNGPQSPDEEDRNTRSQV